MKKLDVREILDSHKEYLESNYAIYRLTRFKFIRELFIYSFSRLLKFHKINDIIERFNTQNDFEFIESVLNFLNVGYIVSEEDLRKIPPKGKLLIVANHPVGGLESLAMLLMVSRVRRDVKFVVNDILMNLENINRLFLPFKLDSNEYQINNIKKIFASISREEAIIIFPAGQVARIKNWKIREDHWHNGAVYMAKKFKTPILPVYIKARNSFTFYFTSLISKALSKILLPRELFNKKGKTFGIKIGNLIPKEVFETDNLSEDDFTCILKEHVEAIKDNSDAIFKPELQIIPPVNKKLLKADLKNAELIYVEGKKYYLYYFEKRKAPYLFKELTRLREITFRSEGEGTGKSADSDIYDENYLHLILWDDNEKEIIGAYRLGDTRHIIKKLGISGIYSSSLFEYSKEFTETYFDNTLELGRSWIQVKYRNIPAIDLLWKGIGHYVRNNSHIKYYLGPISISTIYPESLRTLIVIFLKKWFYKKANMVVAKTPFIIDEKYEKEFEGMFSIKDFNEDMNKIRQYFKERKYNYPTLLRHYFNYCTTDGYEIFDFNIDRNFNNCIDALLLVNLEYIRPEIYNRYISWNYPKQEI